MDSRRTDGTEEEKIPSTVCEPDSMQAHWSCQPYRPSLSTCRPTHAHRTSDEEDGVHY